MHLISTLFLITALLGVSQLQNAEPEDKATAEPKPEPPPEVCNIVAAVDCFDKMPELSEPHRITGDPMGEIEAPCKLETEVYATLKTCLQVSLAGCPTIWKDSQLLITQSEGFCKKVIGCQSFSSQYRNSLQCSLQMFTALMLQTAPNNTKTDCTDLSNCMKKHITICAALSMFLEEQWGLFQKTCDKVQVMTPTVLLPAANVTPPMAVCPKLIEVTKAVKACHSVMLADMQGTMNVTKHCMAAKAFIDCANTTLVQNCPVTSGYQEIMHNSIKDYIIGISPFCGEGMSMAPEEVCNIGDVPACFSNVNLNMWKIESFIIEGSFTDSTTNITEVVEKASQITSFSRDVATMCIKVNETVTPVETCIAKQTKGCDSELQELYQQNPKYLRDLCKDLTGCGNFSTLSTGLGKCTDTATTTLNALKSKGITDMNLLKKDFCKIFDDMMICMDKFLTPLPCYNSSEHIHALYHLLADGLSDVCPYNNFTMVKFGLGDEMEEFVECSDLPQVSFEIGMCTNQYLQTLAQHPTQQDLACSALNQWQNCSVTVAHDCDMMYFHIKEMGEEAREKMPSCVMPTLPPVTEPPSTDKNTSNGTPSINVTDKEGNIIVRTTPSSIGAVTSPSMMIPLLALLSVIVLEIIF